jgi:hypothetical protein
MEQPQDHANGDEKPHDRDNGDQGHEYRPSADGTVSMNLSFAARWP